MSAQPDSIGADDTLLDYKPQDYGKAPTEVRETDKYTDEYVRGFVEKWDALIDWDRRSESEGTFFIEALKARGVKRILDIATGTGFHSVRLIEAGFEVVSADGSPYMLAKAFENGRRRGHIIRTVQADWRWLNKSIHGRFDAVICLGNSFTHLFDERDRRKTLAECYAALKHDGVAFERARVGDRYVFERLRHLNGTIGGESSGHILCLDRATTGDGIVSALQVMAAMATRDESLQALVAPVEKCPQKLVNVPIARGSADALMRDERVTTAVGKAEAALGGEGRVLLRPSGTEPLLRVMVEGLDGGAVENHAHALADVVSEAAGTAANA